MNHNVYPLNFCNLFAMALTWINGEFIEDENACLHINDLAIQRGYGVFDFFAVNRPGSDKHWPKPFLLSSYLTRFFNSAKGISLEVPYSKAELTEIILQFIQKNRLQKHGIKMILTGGYSEDGFTPLKPNFIIRAYELNIPSKEKFQAGMKVITHEYQRSTPPYKTLDYLHAIALLPSLKQKGLDDVLYHTRGIISELPRSNFFMLDQYHKLITPARNILEGITRKTVLHVAREHHTVEERDIRVDELVGAKEAFLTSSTKLIMPITEIDGQLVGDGKPGPITSRLSQLIQQLPQNFEFP